MRKKKLAKKNFIKNVSQPDRGRSVRHSGTHYVRPNVAGEHDVVAILEDIDNGNEYYVSIVDSFEFANRSYVAMTSFEPPARYHDDPEVIIMRFDTGPNGERYYQSIRNRRELDGAFDVFFDRYIHNIR
ncbi:MAG TPA: DUF1292 domain-containing protein [Clostridiaceae bacterium]|nr:DUF1292 domain-containing protein [Clostridiaceae bacterium]